MIIYTHGFEEGYNSILELEHNGRNMQMDVGILKLTKGGSFRIFENDKETALLLLTGAARLCCDAGQLEARRKSLHDEAPYCLHVSRQTETRVECTEDCEIYVQKTLNERSFTPAFYKPSDIQVQKAGMGDVLKGCMRRNIRTAFDYENAPYSNMVLGEVVNFPGKWSSYPPHHHPQPEVYFYRFDHPQGFGASFIGDEAFTIRHNSLALIRPDVCHPQAAAPGYAMYYVWGIRHLPGDPWIKTRIDAEEHEWLWEPDAKIWDEKA
jgi:5-deoxy-glucuronate isomerase